MSPVFIQLVIPSRNASHTTYDRKISASGRDFFFMSLKKYILLISVIVALSAGAYFSERLFLSSSAPISTPTVSAPITTKAADPAPRQSDSLAVPVPKPTNERAQTVIATISTPQPPNVTFTVSGTSYGVYAPSGTTVLDAMRGLISTSDFTFTGREYASLGFFVDSIDGKRAENGYNWILYINGKLSSTGASQTILTVGDTAEWKYEKNY